jgi:putative transcriptional regulator
MTRHHPKDTTLGEFAAGTLNEGRSLIVATHLTMCEHCRGFVAALEEAGGQMLDRVEPVAMSEGAVSLTMARLAAEPRASGNGPRTPLKAWTSQQEALLGYDLGPWNWIAPGLHYRDVKIPADSDTRVFMLKAAPGMKIPVHDHTGTELTCVLTGAFIHEGGRYAAGDCDDADQDVGHSPVIDLGEECVCLVAMQGQIKLTGLLGRLIQPFIRI